MPPLTVQNLNLNEICNLRGGFAATAWPKNGELSVPM